MGRRLLEALVLAVCSAAIFSCGRTEVVDNQAQGFESLSGPHFGLVAPTKAPEVFLPELVSTAENERCVTFLDSGRVCLFTTDNGGTWFTALNGESWSAPERFPFNYAEDMLDYTAGPDGRTLVFMTSRPVDENDPGTTHHQWTVEWTGNGWADPVPLPAPEKIEGLGSGYPALAADGTLYFISDPRDGATEGGIFRCRVENGRYLPAELVEHPVNTPYIEFDPTVAPDHSYLVFNSNRPGGFGLYDQYVVFRRADGSWTPALNFGPGFNTEYSEACPNVTPDGGLLLFASTRPSDFLLDDDSKPVATGRDVYWSDTSVIESLRDRYLDTTSSAEILRTALANGGLDAAAAMLEDLHERSRSDYSFTPEELLEICTELAAAGNTAGADAFYEALVRVLPEKERLKLGYAVVSALHGRLDVSEEIVDDLQSSIPGFNLEYAVLNVGVHLEQASKTHDVITHYEVWRDDLPASYWLRYDLATAYDQAGETERALEQCRRALELSPENPYLIELMERLGEDPGNPS